MKTLAKIGLSLLGLMLLYKGAHATSAYIVAEGMAVDFVPESRVDAEGVEIVTHVKITNPTDKSMRLTSPFVQLLHRSEAISQNQVSGNKIDIKPYSNTDIPIALKLSWTQISDLMQSVNVNFPQGYNSLDKAMWLYQNYTQIINALGLQVKYSTSANGFPYKGTEPLEL